ncbi:2OG-Fe(II) oxygenase [Leptothermofonsia sichuanensis E412]|uniref:2OG-Fe(II) oxygenase n=1 Tax=Leptothermofonsia sichuanensis TaxID=2917832 RepID=UPI001CA6C359|nr:2OG-Fe(II) oxygenase [Leptothermofonsia sichuanensis]QZZ18580.1 2OG-Fe(II) oxygenase [Leptothermofonsia sichuanensis E412]
MPSQTAPLNKSRWEFADQIRARLLACKEDLQTEFQVGDRIASCYMDDLLDEADARAIYQAFPKPSEMLLLKDLREFKYVGLQMNRFHPILEEIIYAFQHPGIVQLVSEITGIPNLLPDEYLYAGGISLMHQGCYLNPHLDNSHDKDRQNYRVMNLLYYVTPDWQPEYGGNLELWDRGVKQPCRTIHSRFNRLVMMVTHRSSWHSVSKVLHQGQRCCVSNYYFSPHPLEERDYFHITSFRGRPEQPIRDIVLRGDIVLRSGVRQVFKHGIRQPHFYRQRSK